MQKTTLVIMAAGMGSRFGGGIKQLEPMGPNGEIIMDYSIYDAMRAGFDDVVFVTRKDLLPVFKEVIGDRIAKVMPVSYCFQELDDIPDGFTVPEGRKKPWGTGQAILVCRKTVRNPFLVINADDYYGQTAFRLIHDYLVEDHGKGTKMPLCMAGFILGNTLSDNGSVTRGIASVDGNGFLTGVRETGGLVKTEDGAACDGPDGTKVPVSRDLPVSMNMWGFTPEIFGALEDGFRAFLKENDTNLKAEYLLPDVVDRLIKTGRADVRVLTTPDKWFGVTYKEDKDVVMRSIRKLIADGVYPEKLYG